MLTMGHIEQSIVRQVLKNKQSIPTSILNKPELLPGLELYLDSFFDLETERDFGFGPGLIKWSSIKNYAEYMQFDEEQTDRLFYHIRVMDNVRLEQYHKQNQNKGSK